jgi:hypothetical protein
MSCPSSLSKPAASLIPNSMYNFSYSSLFPKAYCEKCGYGYTPGKGGQCESYEKYQDILKNASLFTSGNCPYGHIQLPGMPGCTSLLTGAFRATEDSVISNGQSVQIQPRRNTSSCVPCNNGNDMGCSSCY